MDVPVCKISREWNRIPLIIGNDSFLDEITLSQNCTQIVQLILDQGILKMPPFIFSTNIGHLCVFILTKSDVVVS